MFEQTVSKRVWTSNFDYNLGCADLPRLSKKKNNNENLALFSLFYSKEAERE